MFELDSDAFLHLNPGNGETAVVGQFNGYRHNFTPKSLPIIEAVALQIFNGARH